MDEKELINRIIEHNDHQAYKILVDKYKRMVISTCQAFSGNYHDAEDIAQDVFVELYESLHHFRHDSKLSTWLYRISVNKSLNFIRRKKRMSLFDVLSASKDKTEQPIDNLAGLDEPNLNIEKKEQQRALRKAISKLPENQRIAIVLSTYHELSYKEIAEVMETSVSSVESLLFRARNNLRKIMVKSN